MMNTLFVVPMVFPPIPQTPSVASISAHLKRDRSLSVTFIQMCQQLLRFSPNIQLVLGKLLRERTTLSEECEVEIRRRIDTGARVVLINPIWKTAFNYKATYKNQILVYLVDRAARLGVAIEECPYPVYSYDAKEEGAAYVPPFATVYAASLSRGSRYDLFYVGGFSIARYVMVVLAKALAVLAGKKVLLVLYSGRPLINWLPLTRSRQIPWKLNVRLLMKSRATVEYLLGDCKAPSVRWFDGMANKKIVLTNNYLSPATFDPFMLLTLGRFLIFNRQPNIQNKAPVIFFNEWLQRLSRLDPSFPSFLQSVVREGRKA